MSQIKVSMFKEFTLTFNQQEIAFDKIMTRKMCGLLQLLVYNNTCISKEELIDELWQDASNPLNSLKQTIFRLRMTLGEIECFQGMNLITTIKNGYKFADGFELVSDYKCADEYYARMLDQNISKKESVSYAEKILSLYKERFFVSDAANWSTQVRAYYHNIYEKAFILICEEYIDTNRGQELLPIIEKAIQMDEFYDDAYIYQMKAFMNLKEFNKAMELYQHISELYERELGHSPSIHLKSMYRVITSRDENVIDVVGLKKRLNSISTKPSAMYCDYDTFKYIYKVSLNNARRDNKEIFLLLFQLDSKESDKRQEQFIAKLKKIMTGCLRSGDVFSKINRTQVIALLPCETVDNGYMVIQRITSKFYKNTNEKEVRLHYFISPIMDFNEEEFVA
ncbi:AfsR/SARP family transcriptional regulator [Amedibacillus sp. YH-ame6]